ncbi:MAG: hypothetical protein RBS89_06145 [Candidatus Delongbacteria bacterium]|jgi:hypothetical protein|nr:hypothetical protein [Candidatus Delongbacteria bacterium]
MKKYFSRGVILAILLSLVAIPAFSQEKSEVSLPWNEFKSLVNLDKDQMIIPIATFEKLVLQTGRQDYKPQNIVNGNVIISQAEFKKLVDGMKAPSGLNLTPPYEYLVTKAVYKGKMNRENTDFTATFLVHVLKDDQYLKIPVIPNSTAVEDIKVNGKPALIVSESGYSNVVLQGKGEYRIEAEFSVKSTLEKGPYELYININKTPITLFELEIPMPQIEVEIPQANQISTNEKNKVTYVSAVITESYSISVKWRKKFEIIEKLPPKVYADLNHLISIEDNALKTTTQINYNILHSEIETVAVSIDDNVNILNIYGAGTGEWQEIIKKDVRQIIIPFTYGKKGNAGVSIVTETPLSAEGLETAFTGIKTLNTIRETGSIGIELNTSAEVTVTENKGLERIAVQTLPTEILNRSAKPLIEGFKYAKHPFQLMLNIKKHKKIGVPMAAAYSANAVTLFTEDGKIVHSIEYKIKNSSKQFLEIKLPADAQVFSVFVNGNPVESSLNDDGKLLIPLIRSNSLNSTTDTFPVEVIFANSEEKFSFFGTKNTIIPPIDLFTSQIMWSVYIPHGYKYIYFDSSLEKEELIRGVNIFGGEERIYDEGNEIDGEMEYDSYSDKDTGRSREAKSQLSEFRNAPVAAEEQMVQMKKEKSFGRKMDELALSAPSVTQAAGMTGTGLMPIRIKIPTTGQVYRFAKTVVNPEDPLTFKVYFVQSWVPKAVKWLFWIIVILIIYLIGKRLFKKFLSSEEEVEENTVVFDDTGKIEPDASESPKVDEKDTDGKE